MYLRIVHPRSERPAPLRPAAYTTTARAPTYVDLETAELRIATLKRRRDHWRAVPVPEDLVQALPRGRKAALWPITRQAAHRQVGALMAAAGIAGPQACPRGLRHGYGVAAVSAGVPLPTVAAVLGHASLETTAIYTTAMGPRAPRPGMDRLRYGSRPAPDDT